MYKIISIQTRPNTSVAFWTRENTAITAEFGAYYRDTYIVTGKNIHIETEVSADGLNLTVTHIWDSKESVDAWREDAKVQSDFFAPQEAYFEANGITVTRSFEEI
jgi:hypothetical protein